jgi:hypothetical protein
MPPKEIGRGRKGPLLLISLPGLLLFVGGSCGLQVCYLRQTPCCLLRKEFRKLVVAGIAGVAHQIQYAHQLSL